MPKVLLTRPLDQSLPLSRKLEAAGFDVAVAPMLEIESMVASIPPLNHAQALVFCSQNAVRMFSRRCRENGIDASHLPAFCVGDTTSHTASQVGFKDVRNAGGDARDVLRLILDQTRPNGGIVVHVRGADVAHDIAKQLLDYGYQTESTVMYSARTAHEVDAGIVNEMYAGEINFVLFFSARTAMTFANLAKAHGFAAAAPQMTAICMSRNVADMARKGVHWRHVRVADQPNENAMLDALRDAAAA